ncbi:MAG: hypothetical protein Q9162_001207 [Coniocarpon cinnabarinum]
MALNFKGVPYQTEWTEYPEIAPTLKAQGVPPNECPPASFLYTIPTVRFDDNTIIMDSKPIAAELEKRHPSPSLHLNSPLVSKVEELLPKIVRPLVPILLPATPRNLLNKPSFDFFQETRKQMFGMPLDEYEKQKGGEHVWDDAKPGFEQMASLLHENEGPFFMGQTPSYADFILVSCIKWFQRIDDRFFQKAVSHDEIFRKQFDACQKWMERDAE